MKCSTGLLSVSTALLVSAFFVSGNLLRQEAQGLVVRRLGITDGSSDVLLKAFLLESGLSNTLEGYPNKCLSEYYRSNSQPLLTAEDIEASLTDQWWGLDPDVEQDEVLTTRFIPSDELPRVHAQDIDLRTRELTGVNDTAYSSSLSHLKDQVYGHTYQKRSVLLPRIPTTSIQGSSSPISSQAENEPRQYSGQQSSMGSVSAPVSRAGSPNRPRLATGAQQQQSTPGSPNMDRVQSLPSEGHSFNNPRPRFPVRRPNTLQFLVDLAHNYRPGGQPLPSPRQVRPTMRSLFQATAPSASLGVSPPQGPPFGSPPTRPGSNGNDGRGGRQGSRSPPQPNIPNQQRPSNRPFSSPPPPSPRQRSSSHTSGKPNLRKRSFSLQTGQISNQASGSKISKVQPGKLQFSKRDPPRSRCGTPPSPASRTPMTSALQRASSPKPLLPFAPMTNALRQRAALTTNPSTHITTPNPASARVSAQRRDTPAPPTTPQANQARFPGTRAQDRSHVSRPSRRLIPFAAAVGDPHQASSSRAGPSRPAAAAAADRNTRRSSQYLRQPISTSEFGHAAAAAR